MATFSYKAMDSGGRSQGGSVSAPNRASALEQLAQRGLIPVAVDELAAAAAPVRAPATTTARVSQASAEAFIRELSNLLAGAVPLSRALQILAREATGAGAKAQWTAVHDDVVGGQSLAEAMGRWSRTFTPVQTAMVRAGETGGFLDVVLGQIADFRSRERDLKGKVKGALVYPAILATLSCGVLIFLLTFFIPRFSGIFSEFGAALPALTRGIIAASAIVTQYGLFLLVVLVAAVLLVRRALTTQAGRRLMERAMLRAPGLGIVLARFALVRF